MISVLYVDDEPALLDIGKTFLEQSGSITVEICHTAADAREQLAKHHYDAIVSDYQMPVTNGIEFLKYIRTRYSDLPFILFTGRGREEVVIEALNLGADFYLQKGGNPVPQFAELEHKIKQAVHQKQSERRINESEEQYRTLFEGASDAIFMMEQGVYIDCNTKALEYFGCSREQLIGSHPCDLSPATQPDGISSIEKSRELMQVVIGGTPRLFDWRHRRLDGREFDVEISLSRLDVKGRNLLLAIMRDVHERKQVECALRESAQLMTNIISFLPDATFAINTDGRVIAWNQAMEKMTGISAGAMIGKGDYEYSLPIYGERRPILIDLILSRDETIFSRYTTIDADGTNLISEVFAPGLNSGRGAHLWFTASPLIDTQGNVIGAIESIRDITARKNRQNELQASYEQIAAMEEELRNNFEELAARERLVAESDANYRALFSAMVEGHAVNELVYDGNGMPVEYRILQVNPAFEKIFAIPTNTAIGRTSREIFERDEPGAFALYAEVACTGIPRHFEIWYPLMKKHFSISVYSPKRGTFATVFEDITDRRQKEDELRAAYEQISAVEEELRNNFEELTSREQELRESAQRMTNIISFLPDATFVINSDGRVIAWNRAMETLTGISADAMVGKGDYEYSIPIYGKRRPILIDLILSKDESIASHYTTIEKEGTTLFSEVFVPGLYSGKGAHIWFTASPLVDTRGKVIGAIESIRDITAHKNRMIDLQASYEQIAAMEEELRNNFEELASRERLVAESDANYRALFSAMVEGHAVNELVYDGNGMPVEYRIRQVNPAFEKIFNIPRDTATGKMSREVFGGDEPRALALFAEVARTGTPRHFEIWYPRMKKHLAISVYSPKKGTFGTVFEDITERRQKENELRTAYEQITAIEEELRSNLEDLAAREKALQTSEEGYRQIVETANEGIWSMDHGLRATFVNSRLADMLGYSPDEILGRPVEDFMHPEEMPDHAEKKRLRRAGNRSVYERKFCKKDGTTLWCQVSATPLLDARGMFQGSFAMLTDITARKIARQELELKNQELNTANEQMAAAFEELKSTEELLVARNRELEEQQESIRRAKKALKIANRKLNLLSGLTRHDVVNQLTALSGYVELSSRFVQDPKFQLMIEKERKVIDMINQQILFTKEYEDMGVNAPVWQDLGKTVMNAATGLDLSGVCLKVESDNLEIFADPLLGRGFYNLMDNTLRYGRTVSEITVCCERKDGGLIITYIDNGVGIDAEARPHLFERGFGKHTGLGLFFTREVLSITGLSIAETGTPGKGVRFEINVPEGDYRFTDTQASS
ncbi:MAG: PAS domain S-box protein [Methanoregula sp.]